jgi:hypothetical protein
MDLSGHSARLPVWPPRPAGSPGPLAAWLAWPAGCLARLARFSGELFGGGTGGRTPVQLARLATARLAKRGSCGATQATPPRCAVPASEPEYVGDFSRYFARPARDIGPAEAQRDDPRSGAEIVPADIPPAILDQMRCPAVQFHGHAERFIEVVQILRPRPSDHLGLPFRRRQAMSELDVADVAPLQVRVHSLSDAFKRAENFVPPAQPLALVDSRTKHFRCDEPSAASLAQPGEGSVEASRVLGEVEHGLLDAGPRRGPGRMPDGVDSVSPVNDDARCLLVPFLAGDFDSVVMADGDVDDVARLVR